MKQVNALKMRNNLGKILDQHNETGEPILVSKDRKLRAALVTLEGFEKRFLDYRIKEDKKTAGFYACLEKKEPMESIDILRHPMTEDLVIKSVRKERSYRIR